MFLILPLGEIELKRVSFSSSTRTFIAHRMQLRASSAASNIRDRQLIKMILKRKLKSTQ